MKAAKAGNGQAGLRAAAVFSGIGGFCEGLRQAGIETDWAVEHDSNAVATYEENFPGVRIVRYPPGHGKEGAPKDIRDVAVTDDRLRPVDILTAGFPCQSFSQAGSRLGFGDERGQLFFELMRIIKEFKDARPKLLIFENVPYLKIGDGGAWFARVKFEIQCAGYWFGDSNADVLDPLALGILPQRRERLFMVAASTAYFRKNDFEFPSGNAASHPDVRDYLDKVDPQDDRYYISPDNRYFCELMEVLRDKPQGCLVQYRKYYARDIKDGICPTLTANMGQGGHNVPFLRSGDRIRKLTEAECARLQGFTDLRFPESVSSIWRYTQVGNSVAVPVAKLLAERAKELIARH